MIACSKGFYFLIITVNIAGTRGLCLLRHASCRKEVHCGQHSYLHNIRIHHVHLYSSVCMKGEGSQENFGERGCRIFYILRVIGHLFSIGGEKATDVGFVCKYKTQQQTRPAKFSEAHG